MCGIAGFVDNRRHRAETIARMTDCLYHRGPDAGGTWMDEHSGVTLGFRRLAIRDVSSNGMQPMLDPGGRYVIVYNGEIYNAAELKHAMEEAGFRDSYRGSSDTEILLNAFVHYGVLETLAKVKGMFAIALYDRSEKRLYLMRDRIGEKPLFYGYVSGRFVFASELSAVRVFPGFTGQLQPAVLPAYMQYGYIPAPDTIYEGIYKLLPGQLLTLDIRRDTLQRESYYDLTEAARRGEREPFEGSLSEAADRLEQLLREAIRGQMISDVPLGAYLSGGTDSAVVTALMTQLSESPVSTFSIGFTEKKYDEAPEARAIAEHLGTKHHEQYVTERELLEVIPQIPRIYGEPYADSSQIPTYLVSRLAKSEVTVALSGDAGDELFGGYVTYPKMLRLWRQLSTVPGGLRHIAGGAGRRLCGGNRKLYRAAMCLCADNILELKEAVDHTDPLIGRLAYRALPLQKETLLRDELTEMLLADLLHYHPDDILVKVDRAGMAVSLENRIPMLDRDVVEFAFSLPSDYKHDGMTAKKVLKEVLYRYVPRELMERPKKGFAVPLERWLKEGETAAWAEELLTGARVVTDGLLDEKSVSRLWRNFRKKGASPRLVWNVLMLEQWYRELH